MKEKIKVGYIGLGRRGGGVLKRDVSCMKDVEVTVICDLHESRLEKYKQIVLENSGHEPLTTTDYKEVLNNPDIDAVFIMIGWSGRPEMAIESMKAGKYTAVEVGTADSLDVCFELVRTYEETGTPVMMLENCCYGRREMAAAKIKELGLFGKIVFCTGAYMHYLNDGELYKIDEDNVPHYRLPQYIKRNRENYPTHALGPLSKLLGINRGNRMLALSSCSTGAFGLQDYAARHMGADSEYARTEFKQGDIVSTFITCEGGEAIRLTLDTTLPRSYYSRDYGVRGTEGLLDEARKVVWFESMGGHTCIAEGAENNEEEMFKKYEHPLYLEYLDEGIKEKEGHGGMDWLVCRAFVESVKRGTNTPIDAYDVALWLSIGPLSEQSVKAGGAPVEIPDFTNGKWKSREPIVEGKYCLDKVCEDRETPIYPE